MTVEASRNGGSWSMKYEADKLSGNRWAVRPEGQCGTCGFYPKPWQVVFVTAATVSEALRKAERVRDKGRK